MVYNFNNTNYGVPNIRCEYWFCNCQIMKFWKNLLPFVILFVLLVVLGSGFTDGIVWLASGAMKMVGAVLITVTKVMMVPIFIFPIGKAPQGSELPPALTTSPLPPSEQLPCPPSEPSADTTASMIAVDISTVKEEVLRLEKCFLDEFSQSESQTRSMLNSLQKRMEDIDLKFNLLSDEFSRSESETRSMFNVLLKRLDNVDNKIWEVKEDLKELLAIVEKLASDKCKMVIAEHFENELVFPCPSQYCPSDTHPSANAFVMRRRHVSSKCVE